MSNELEGLVQRSVRLPLPKTEHALRQFILGALRLEHVTALEVTPTSVYVERFVAAEGVNTDGNVLTPALKAVHAGTSLEPDLGTLLQLLRLDALVFDPSGHVLHLMMRLYEMVREADLQPVALFARRGDDLQAALGLPPGTVLEHLFGVPVTYVDDELEEGSVLLVGSPSPFLSDATYGVAADIGGVT